MLTSIFTSTTTSIQFSALLIASAMAIVLGIVIALTHKFTSKYTKNYLITVSLLPLLVEAVMLMVNGNLGTSVAIMGAFSLVRFRSIPGNSKEILTVFFAMAVGLSLGMGQIVFACFLTAVGCLLIIVFHYVPLFEKNNEEKLLVIDIPENLDYTNIFDDIFEKYTDHVKLMSAKTINMGSLFELKYTITLLKDANEKEFIDSLRTRNGNLKISLSHPLESELDL